MTELYPRELYRPRIGEGRRSGDSPPVFSRKPICGSRREGISTSGAMTLHEDPNLHPNGIEGAVESGENPPISKKEIRASLTSPAGKTLSEWCAENGTYGASILKEWDTVRNLAEFGIDPDDCPAGSNKKGHWICSNDPTHQWTTRVVARTHGSGCRRCSVTDLEKGLPLRGWCKKNGERGKELLAEWDTEKNAQDGLTPDNVTASSQKKVHWICSNNSLHRWKARLSSRTYNTRGCSVCVRRKIDPANTLRSWCEKNGERGKQILAEWDTEKNAQNGFTPDTVGKASSLQRIYWICSTDPSHKWEAWITDRTRNPGFCPECRGQQPSLLELWCDENGERGEQLRNEWDTEANKKEGLLFSEVTKASGKKAHWTCSEEPTHKWIAPVANRKNGSGCPFCCQKRINDSNSLRTWCDANGEWGQRLLREWDTNENTKRGLTLDTVSVKTSRKALWMCSENPDHKWEAPIATRTGGGRCFRCQGWWTKSRIIEFVRSLRDHLRDMTPVELATVLAQSGMLESSLHTFGSLLETGHLDIEDLVDAVDSGQDDIDIYRELVDRGKKHKADSAKAAIVSSLSDSRPETTVRAWPAVGARDVLGTLNALCLKVSGDAEAIEFFIESALAKLWAHAYEDSREVVKQLRAKVRGKYAEAVRTRFLEEYREAQDLEIPEGYRFERNGKKCKPLLMQRRAAAQLKKKRRTGNWSGQGAGKTLSGVLASRVIGAKVTVILCPNAVVQGWATTIRNAYRASEVVTGTLTPRWRTKHPKYLVVNYEKLQQPDSEKLVRAFVEDRKIDCIIADEIQFTKQRATKTSKRRKILGGLVSMAAQRNPKLAVLGMTATPVINNLKEFVSLLELITGHSYEEAGTTPTLENAIYLHQQLVRHGIRWLPAYDTLTNHIEKEIELQQDAIQRLRYARGEILKIEQILTEVRLPHIIDHLKQMRETEDEVRAVVYTYYVSGIIDHLVKAIEEAGFRVGVHTQGDKSGLQLFMDGEVEVLVGSQTIGTGVDGLQDVCSTLIINTLPWTAAEYEHLLGRFIRTGQEKDVDIFLPITYATYTGVEWSWCRNRVARLRWKKSLGDAVTDGVIPDSDQLSPTRVAKEMVKWLDRLETSGEHEVVRPVLVEVLQGASSQKRKGNGHGFGDMATRLASYRRARSSTTHKRFQDNPDEWLWFHTTTESSKRNWALNPLRRIGDILLRIRKGRVVADLGCGMAKLATRLHGHHEVQSYDHVAVNDDVVACDITKLPLGDEAVDYAVVCLALWGSNWTDTLSEAARILGYRGRLLLAENLNKDRCTPAKITVEELCDKISEAGLTVTRCEEDRGFVFIEADK